MSKKSPKNSSCKKVFNFVLWIRAFYAIFLRWKSMYLRTCGSFKSAILKKDGVRKPESATFAEGPQIQHII